MARSAPDAMPTADRPAAIVTRLRRWEATAQRVSLLAACCLLFALALGALDRASIWTDEAWSIWVAQLPWSGLLQTVAGDVHPPLYFLLLKPWIALTGESAFATRFLSTGAGLVGLAITYALGRRLLDGWGGLVALLWLGTHGFVLYYLRESRMYSLLLAGAALSMWAYLAWLARPTRRSALLVVLITTGIAYLHYFAPLITITQGLHLLLVHPRRLPRWLLLSGSSALLFLPWAGVAAQQWWAHPGGAHLATTPTSWASVRQLLLILSGGAGLLLLVPWALGDALSQLWRRSLLWLLPLWLIVTPAALLAANAWLLPIYEARYVVGVLPAVALLVTYGLRRLRWPWLGGGMLALLLAINLGSAAELRPPKAPWAAIIGQVLTLRQLGEPTLLKIVEPSSLEAYFSRTLPLRNETTIDLSDGGRSLNALREQVRALPADKPVWLVMPHNIGETWVALATLSTTRGVGFRRAVDHMLFYRFDPAGGDALQLRFGDQVQLIGQLLPPQQASAGENLCLDIPLQATASLDPVYSYGLHLIDASGRLVAQVDQGLGDHRPGESFHLTPCLALPGDLPAGDYALHLVIYRWADGQRLTVYEADQAWGNALVMGMVTIGQE
jgi:uncharacterized membrane protein